MLERDDGGRNTGCSVLARLLQRTLDASARCQSPPDADPDGTGEQRARYHTKPKEGPAYRVRGRVFERIWQSTDAIGPAVRWVCVNVTASGETGPPHTFRDAVKNKTSD